MLRKGHVGYWCYALEVTEEEVRVEDILVACEFPNVFPEELPGLPTQREIDFEIELIPGAQPISKAPFQLVPTVLKESKTQLEEILQKDSLGQVCLRGEPQCRL